MEPMEQDPTATHEYTIKLRAGGDTQRVIREVHSAFDALATHLPHWESIEVAEVKRADIDNTATDAAISAVKEM